MTPQRNARSEGSEEQLATGLGWFSIGLGLGELIAPGAMARLIGVSNERGNRKVLRLYGLREIGAGIGILSQPRPAGWVWSRVAGDLLDIGSLTLAMISSENRLRLTAAIGAVLGVTALDIYCADQLNRLPENIHPDRPAAPAAAVITIDRSPDELRAEWRNFQQSRARSGASKLFTSPIEFSENPSTHRLTFHSSTVAGLKTSGTIAFETAPAGRGTVVRAEIDEPAGGSVVQAAGKLLGMVGSELMQNELRMFKQVIETGEIATSEASAHTGPHAAQPSPELVHA
jgi:hypothetical protein